jgi:hypothetical protein
LVDLPVNSGVKMVGWTAAWQHVAPIAEVRPTGYAIEANAARPAQDIVWFGVRPNDTVVLSGVTFEDDGCVLTFTGVGHSDGRDTKIRLFSRTLAEVKPVLDQLLSTADPIDPAWRADVQQAIRDRRVINGMTKQQAHLSVGEPLSANVQEVAGRRVETWSTRQFDGIRVSVDVVPTTTGFPAMFRFEDGVVVGLATTASGRVNLGDSSVVRCSRTVRNAGCSRADFTCCAFSPFHACCHHYPGGPFGCECRSRPLRRRPSPYCGGSAPTARMAR